MNKPPVQPVSWPVCLLVALPGLFLAISRFNIEALRPFFPATILVFVIPALAIPILWWRKRAVPVWGLLPGGAMAWLLVYYLATGLVALSPVRLRLEPLVIMNILQLALAAALFAVLLRDQRRSRRVWISAGLVALVTILTVVILARNDAGRPAYLNNPLAFLIALSGPAEGLFLVALGLLAARRHGVLAVLAIMGGYVYLFTDSDYLLGYSLRDWPGLQPYLATMTFLFMVVAPVALLRARTAAGRAAGLFAPAILVLAARLVVPALAVNVPVSRPGDILISITVFLSLVLGWVLYSDMGGAPRESPANGPVLSPG